MNKYFVLVLVLLCGFANSQRSSRQRGPPRPGFENLFFPNGRPPPAPDSGFFPGSFPGSFPGGNGRDFGNQGGRDREDQWMREPERDNNSEDNFLRPARQQNEWGLPNSNNNWPNNGGNTWGSNGGGSNNRPNGGGNRRPNNGGNNWGNNGGNGGNNWGNNDGMNWGNNGGGSNNRPSNGGGSNWSNNGNNRPGGGNDNNNGNNRPGGGNSNNNGNNRPGGGNGNNNNNNGNWNNDRTTTTTFKPTLKAPLAIVHNPPAGCTCQVGPQYNPVCGSDGQNYRNKELLDCVARCGTRVTMRRRGTC